MMLDQCLDCDLKAKEWLPEWYMEGDREVSRKVIGSWKEVKLNEIAFPPRAVVHFG